MNVVHILVLHQCSLYLSWTMRSVLCVHACTDFKPEVSAAWSRSSPSRASRHASLGQPEREQKPGYGFLFAVNLQPDNRSWVSHPRNEESVTWRQTKLTVTRNNGGFQNHFRLLSFVRVAYIVSFRPWHQCTNPCKLSWCSQCLCNLLIHHPLSFVSWTRVSHTKTSEVISIRG